MSKIAAVFLFSILLFGCKSDHGVLVNDIESISVSRFKSHSFVSEAEYGMDSSELSQFKLWMKDNIGGWDPYIATAAVGDVLIQGSKFSLNVGKNWAILNYEVAPNEYRQLRKSIDSNDFRFLDNNSYEFELPTDGRSEGRE